MRVLVAEDDAVTAEILANAVRAFGYEVTVAGDGREAFELIRTGQYPPGRLRLGNAGDERRRTLPPDPPAPLQRLHLHHPPDARTAASDSVVEA